MSVLSSLRSRHISYLTGATSDTDVSIHHYQTRKKKIFIKVILTKKEKRKKRCLIKYSYPPFRIWPASLLYTWEAPASPVLKS
jgi:hypothetical protein